MIYRLLATLAFTTEGPPDDILDKIKDHFSEAITINPGTPNEEKSSVTLEECYHDQDPNEPCLQIYHDESS